MSKQNIREKWLRFTAETNALDFWEEMGSGLDYINWRSQTDGTGIQHASCIIGKLRGSHLKY